jgi:hypothetical protein
MWLINLGRFALASNYVYRILLTGILLAGLLKKMGQPRGREAL